MDIPASTLPDLDSLRCFRAAARHLNFRRGAEEVALSPPAFSDRIARLEALLGVRLFARTTRSVALTGAGRRLLPEAEALLAQARRCVRAVWEEGQEPPYSLRIGTRYELGLSWLVPAIDALRGARPERSLALHFADSRDLVDRLLAGELDGVITSARLSRPGLRTAPLHEERYVFVASPALLARQPFGCVADAASHRLLDLHGDLPLLRYFTDVRPAREEWRFGGLELLGTIAAVRHRVLESAGVAVLPRYFVAPDLLAGRVIRLFPDTELLRDMFRLVWAEGHGMEEALRGLASELAERPLC